MYYYLTLLDGGSGDLVSDMFASKPIFEVARANFLRKCGARVINTAIADGALMWGGDAPTVRPRDFSDIKIRVEGVLPADTDLSAFRDIGSRIIVRKSPALDRAWDIIVVTNTRQDGKLWGTTVVRETAHVATVTWKTVFQYSPTAGVPLESLPECDAGDDDNDNDADASAASACATSFDADIRAAVEKRRVKLEGLFPPSPPPAPLPLVYGKEEESEDEEEDDQSWDGDSDADSDSETCTTTKPVAISASPHPHRSAFTNLTPVTRVTSDPALPSASDSDSDSASDSDSSSSASLSLSDVD
jgi:hypothetical protein